MNRKKFDPKLFTGKERIYASVAGSPRVSRLFIWNASAGEYQPPVRGKQYQARRYRGANQRETEFFHSLKEARDWQNQKVSSNKPDVAISSFDSGDAPPKDRESKELGMTFGDLVSQWKQRCFPGLTESTRLQYEKLLALYFSPLMPLPVVAITPTKVDEWIDYLKDPENQFVHAPTRIGFKHELRLLTTILKYHEEYDDSGSYVSPIKKRHREAIVVKRERKVALKDLTEEEFLLFRRHLLNGKRGKLMAALATVQFYQALRISEATALHWSDIRFDEREPAKARLRCTKSIFWPRKQGQRGRVVHSFKNAKANDGVKESPLMPETFKTLSELQEQAECDLIFHEGTQPLEYRWIQAAFDRAFKRAGLPYSATHVMRHGMTRVVYNETGDMALAGQLLGNTTERSIRTYAKRSTHALNQYAEKKWNTEAGCNWLQKRKASEEA